MGTKNMTGLNFGLLTVINQAESDFNGNARWNCLCNCGESVTILGFALRNGSATSCGCTSKYERHNKSSSPEYKAWLHMKERCSKPNFARYSGRGISVCDEWNDSFMSFYRDMGDRPSKNHSIERINNDGNYSKENCVWATAEEQANNKCSTKKITAFGETLSMSQWSKKIGIAYGTLVNRLNRAKMNPEDALTKNKFSTAKKI